MIERCRAAFPIRLMCRSLQVSASCYYDWRERGPSPREKANDQLLCHIRRLHADSEGVLGAPPGVGRIAVCRHSLQQKPGCPIDAYQ